MRYFHSLLWAKAWQMICQGRPVAVIKYKMENGKRLFSILRTFISTGTPFYSLSLLKIPAVSLWHKPGLGRAAALRLNLHGSVLTRSGATECRLICPERRHSDAAGQPLPVQGLDPHGYGAFFSISIGSLIFFWAPRFEVFLPDGFLYF